MEKIIVGFQHWEETLSWGWEGQGWYDEYDKSISEPFEVLDIVDTDKHGHPTKAYIKITPKEQSMTETEVLNKFTLPLRYIPGGYIFDSNDQQVSDVTGWHHDRNINNPEELQDMLGEMITKAFNEKYYDRPL